MTRYEGYIEVRGVLIKLKAHTPLWYGSKGFNLTGFNIISRFNITIHHIKLQ
jgi:hypothetical protein